LRSENATVTNLEVCGRRILDCLGRDTSLARRPRQWFRRGLGQRAVSYPAGRGLPGIKATKCRLAIKPGRVIVGNTGILVSRVVYTKQSGEKRFLIQDAAMKDLIRPPLYESFHRLWPVLAPAGVPPALADAETIIARTEPWDVVKPVSEHGDFLARDRHLPRLDRGNVLSISSAKRLRDGHGIP
jgi:diaminopimelate decarboxylase